MSELGPILNLRAVLEELQCLKCTIKHKLQCADVRQPEHDQNEALMAIKGELKELSQILATIDSHLYPYPHSSDTEDSNQDEDEFEDRSPATPRNSGSEFVRRHHKAARKKMRLATNRSSTIDIEKEKLLSELEMLYDKTPIGLCVVDRDLRYIRINQFLADIHGLDVESHIGKTIHETVPNIAKLIEPMFLQVLETGEPVLDNELNTTCKGPQTWLCSFFPFNFSSAHGCIRDSTVNGTRRVEAVTCVIKEITELKQKEEDLIREKRRVEEANQAKSRFLAHMSHELRTPMSGILGMANFLLESDLTPEQREYATSIHQNGSSLLQILNDILDLSKVEAGKIEMEATPFELVTAVEKVAEIFAYKVAEKKIDLRVKVDPTLFQYYIGDPIRIRQILWNLIGNSVKFTDTGFICLEITRLPIQGKEPEMNGVLLKVSDTGIGIPADTLPQIFKEFKQADNSASRKYSGTGLGLAIVDRLVSIMKGRIDVQSEVNKGSSFSIFLPLEPQAGSVTIAQTSVAARLPKLQKESNVQFIMVSPSKCMQDTTHQYLEQVQLKVSCFSTLDDARVAFAGTELDAKNVVFILDAESSSDMDLLRFEVHSWVPNVSVIIFVPFSHRSKLDGFEKHVCYVVKPVLFSHLMSALVKSLTWKDGQVLGEANKPNNGGHYPQFAGMKILVVEDNKTNRIILEHILKKMKCSIDVASNGLEAVNKVKENTYNVVFMDLQMPLMDGYEATRQIRAFERAFKTHVPIIAITAHAMSADRVRCFEAGMDGYVTKPIDPHQIAAIVEEYNPL